MPSLNLRNPLRRDPNRPTLKQRAAALKATAGRLIHKPKPFPAAGSPEALAAFQAACRAVDAASRLSDIEMGALTIAPGSPSLWTSDKATAALCGDFSRFLPREIETARATPKARIEDLQVLALRRELRMAEAARHFRIRELHALAFGNEPDQVDEDEDEAAPANDDVDWYSPPPGFMAFPAIEPTHFFSIRYGIPAELERLRGIARAEYERREPLFRESFADGELEARLSALRDELRLSALDAAIADPKALREADAELIALGRAFNAATVRDREANDALSAAENRAEPHMPERPAALIYREGDNLFPLREYGGAFAGIAVSPSDIEWMTRRPPQREVWVDDPRAQLGVSMVPGKKPRIVHWSEAQARIDEIAAAWDAWHAEQDRVLDEAGVTEARAETDEADAAITVLARQIAAQPACTVEGMRAKLRVAAFHGVCDPDTPEGEGYPGEAAIRSLYRDTPGIEISTNPSDVRIVPEA